MIDKLDLSSKATWLRKKFGYDEMTPIDITNLAQMIFNLTLIFYPLGKSVSGICYKGDKSNIIVINSSMSKGRQNFSLAHELYHLYFDSNKESHISIASIGEGNEIEKSADQFASYFLIPQASLYDKIIKKDKIDIEDVIKLEQYYGISHKAMMYRLENDTTLNIKNISNFNSQIIDIARSLGYNTNLYKKTNKIQVLGYYILKAKELLEKEYISKGKYEELLLSAFRDDIVFGIGENIEEELD